VSQAGTAPRAPAGAIVARRKRARGLVNLGEALLYLAPSLVLFVVFVFLPLGKSVYLSTFTTSPLGVPRTFIGLEWYGELLTSPIFRRSLATTFWFAVYTVPGTIVLALLLAVLANRQLRGINVYRTFFSSTIAVSLAVAATIWALLLNPSIGLLNYVLSLIGIRGPNWLTDPNAALLSISLVTIWSGLGFNTIVLLAGLQGIPEEIYESAKIDGANGPNLFRHITIPLISPSLFFLLVVDTIQVLQAFTQIHVLTRGGPAEATNILVYSIYLDAFVNFQFGYASAQALVLFLIILALTVFQFSVVERRVHYR
jgi:multiple sugar transport system permease protein/sn-glycerol 3-phosphate transport system permease protein